MYYYLKQWNYYYIRKRENLQKALHAKGKM